jgi:hypothetical protein
MLAPAVQGIELKMEAGEERTHGVGDSWEQSTPTGVSKGTLTQSGAFFDTSLPIHAGLSPGFPTPTTRVVCLGVAGNTVGQPIDCVVGDIVADYEVLGQSDKLTKMNIVHTVSGAIERGVIVHKLQAETSAGNNEGAGPDHATEAAALFVPIASVGTGNPATVTTSAPHYLTSTDTVVIAGTTTTPSINGTQTATVTGATTFTIPVNVTSGQAGPAGTAVQGLSNQGGSGYIQVNAITLGGYTSFTVKIRTSTDNSVFVDLLTFTNVTTAPSAERVTVSGAVRRYLAQSIALNGSGSGPSLTYLVAFCRNRNQ